MVHQVPEWEGAPLPSEPRGLFTRKPVTFAASSSLPETTKGEESSTDTFSYAPRIETMSQPKLILKERFDKTVPSNGKYPWGLSRRKFLLIILGAFLGLLALGIGIGVGLGKRHSSHQNLPLPSNGETYTGELTFYATGEGACGHTSSNSESVVAVSRHLFDAESTSSNPNENRLCGKKIRVEHLDERSNVIRTIDVTVVDRCVGCAPTDLDLSPSAFETLDAISRGRMPGTWAWLD